MGSDEINAPSRPELKLDESPGAVELNSHP